VTRVKSNGTLWLLVAVAGVAGLVVLLGHGLPQALGDRDDVPWLIYLGIIAVPLLAALALRFRQRPLEELRNAAIWLAIGLVLLIGYSYREELGGRVMGELVPQRGVVNDDGSVSFRVGMDGHFHVDALVEGTTVRFLVDTGASEVVLTPADARRLGYDPERLTYSQITETANGRGRGAPIRLREVSVGGVTLFDVAASVNEAEMDESLLGMSFLARLSAFEFSGDRLTLRR
jgi:aspartyl protease family protein